MRRIAVAGRIRPPADGFPEGEPELIATANLAVQPSIGLELRPSVRGKFIWVGEEKFYVRGVTYGPFRPNPDGIPYPSPNVVDADFAQIAATGFNAIRTYDVPPRWLLDIAARHGLRVLVGLQVEQRASFLGHDKVARAIKELVRAKVRACAGHPALLAYVIANEIPACMVRWHGARRIERFLEELYWIAKSEDPEGLFCYANYPTTEYLELPFLDLVCFNVYLESQPSFEGYLARLQTLAGNRPLLMTEVGLDSRGNSNVKQAQTLDWQIRTSFRAGCGGAFVFAWTDEWYSRGQDVHDWDFGLTDRERNAKPALAAVRSAFAEAPLPPHTPWPRISVVVCTFNGQRTLRDCLDGLEKLRYPNYEVIVVDDGSKDGTAAIAREYDAWLISTENRGLSAARNTGMEEATGEIVAYIDDDTRPDPDWLSYLAAAFLNTDYVGVGGPNIPFANDGPMASSVASSPGGPTHVLLSDCEAEHIPGCNMAFRKSWLQAVGGFDPQFRVAGDDVDLCWRLQERGGKLGFSPAAVVWHHYRNSVRAYWKQQVGYGKAEALLERKWPEKYNSAGHIAWAGRIYTNGLLRALERARGRIYQGTWGSAAYARLYSSPPSTLMSLPLMPEWYLVSLALAALVSIGYLWKPLLFVLPLLALVVGLQALPVLIEVSRVRFSSDPRTRSARFLLRALTVLLHFLQPLARLRGRMKLGLTPWRRRGASGVAFPRPRTFWLETLDWQASQDRLRSLEAILRADGALVRRGGDFDGWDLEVTGGSLGAARLQMADEVDGTGRQLTRVRAWARFSALGLSLVLLSVLLGAAAAFDQARPVAAGFGALAAGLGALLFRDGAGAAAVVNGSLLKLGFAREDDGQ